MVIFEFGQLSLEHVKHVFVRLRFEASRFQIAYDHPLAIDKCTATLDVSLRDREQIFTH
jgi:hypothetical protein